MLRLYNSLGRRLQDFVPADPVTGIYSCGPTVYSFQHLGNMRPYVFADTLRRALRWENIATRQVVNITDVGHAVADSDTGADKLELAAEKERRNVTELADFYADVWRNDLDALNVMPADEYPRATQYVGQMIDFASELERSGYTYRIPEGLYFDTSRSPRYGTLAQIDVAGQREAARVDVVQGRKNKTDFALWRAEPEGITRIMRWDSPWGPGAPGWHLECSVMSIALLGRHFGIHTGGIDHRELHHVNEIAQSEAYLDDGRPWVRFWLHNEFLQFGDQKMAKSAGHTLRLNDLTEAGYHPMAYRLFLLGSHYRSQLDFSLNAMDAAQATLKRLVTRIAPLHPLPDPAVPAPAGLLDQLTEAIEDDLATPRLLAIVQDTIRRPDLSIEDRKTIIAAADELLGLGLGTLKPDQVTNRNYHTSLTGAELQEVEQLVAERAEARQQKDWRKADQLRDELDRRGVSVTDKSEGTSWELR